MSHWQNKIIAITGGSNGFGLELAQHFSAAGAQVAVLARNEQRLNEVCQASPNLHPIVADVLVDDQVKIAIEAIIQQHGQIDVWINNVGKSTRADLLTCDVEAYQSMMDINFYSAVRCSTAVLPHLANSSGSLVNVGSLACKTAWRNMAPYSTSKHAMAAFSHQVRLEGPPNVHCLLVCPGPIRRDDAGDRYAEEASGLDQAAAQPGAGVKLKGICPKRLADKIDRAIQRRKKELIVPGRTRILFSLLQLSPSLGDWLLKKFAK
ncbi:SDR family NAD(P)-dependent oxidoreductase [Mariniblastus sp.]|nr:SDR family NAD(P)-dependent oxidoreductase [Mariniblastus sp.]